MPKRNIDACIYPPGTWIPVYIPHVYKGHVLTNCESCIFISIVIKGL